MTWTMLLEHLVLVLSALSLAILLGIPLGLLAYLYPKARTPILRTVDLIQTTPALALLGIIMVFMLGLLYTLCCPSCATPIWG